MRNAFIATLVEMASEDERISLITADLGFGVVETFAERFPDRFLNVGVAEANLMGIAAGLAQAGFVPFCYSIATFASMRGYEQLRNGALLHGLPVRVVGIGGGYAYGSGGATHYALEDLSLMRVQPGMTTLAPADPDQTRAALRASVDIPGPIYFRVGKGGNPEVPGLEGRFAFDRPEIVRAGRDVLFLTTGSIVHNALGAAECLAGEGLSAAVAVLAHLGAAHSKELVDLLRSHARIVTVEEGYTAGGLGALVAQAIAEEGLASRLAIRGVREPFSGRTGSPDHMRAKASLSAEQLARTARALVGR